MFFTSEDHAGVCGNACSLCRTLEGNFLVHDFSLKLNRGRQSEKIQWKICDRGDERRRGKERKEKKIEDKKQNAGQAWKDYCMKVVLAARLIMRDITE